MTPRIKLALYEDNPSLRESLKILFGLYPQIDLTGAYPDAEFIIEQTRLNQPDVILMDIDMPGISGIEATSLIHQHFRDVKVLILTVFDDDNRVFKSICAGAVGYLLKKSDSSQIIDGIFQAADGGAPISPSIALKILSLFKKTNLNILEKNNNELSQREKEILTLMTKGYSYKMIAEQCAISVDGVRFHIKNIYEKLHVHSMTEAVAKALKENLI